MTKRGYISLGEIAAKLPMLRIECDRCGRKGQYLTAKLVETYGADASIEPLQQYVTRDCPKRRDPTVELGKGCAPLCPDLLKLPRNQPRRP
jgi:hypothetical protein